MAGLDLFQASLVVFEAVPGFVDLAEIIRFLGAPVCFVRAAVNISLIVTMVVEIIIKITHVMMMVMSIIQDITGDNSISNEGS